MIPLAAIANEAWRAERPDVAADAPFLVVLGIAQDGGVPQAGSFADPRWGQPAERRLVASLALVDPTSSRRWLFDATPDFREQLHRLETVHPGGSSPGLAGIFLTHGHIGHYTGLMFLGHESMGAKGVPVLAMPRMRTFLESGGPWSQLVRLGNIQLESLTDGRSVELAPGIEVTPLVVPHRQEYSEVVGFRVDGPSRSALYLPDIDSWAEWDARGTRVEDVLASVDVAYLDGTFFANGEIPGRDMTTFPHPFISHSLERFARLPAGERAKIRFIHLNHSNPALDPTSDARRKIEALGMRVAEEMERFGL